MRVSEADILFIPGLGGSGPGHWQHRWAEKMSTGRTVDLPDLHKPALDAWIDTIADAIAASERPIVLIGHSLGSLAAVHAMAQRDQTAAIGQNTASPVRAAFLVAPPSERVLRTIGEIDPAFADTEARFIEVWRALPEAPQIVEGLVI